ncbi:UNVERIFIED_CONTAM: NADH-cytochrome b5 reductase [Siphonaria sp. JEL0065]|nr:NADH-cytochrome b5 reductase [Siphonaria sp. JEL0065]
MTVVAALTDPNQFFDFELVDIQDLTHNTKRFTFKLPEGATHLGLPTASAVVTKFDVEGGEPIIRPYTPVEDPAKGVTGTFDLIVKKYPNGPSSTRYFELKKGDKIALKGLIPKYQYQPNKDKEIALLAGGTGITPILQVLQRALSTETDDTKFTLVFGNVSEQDIILKDYLDELAAAHKDRLTVHYIIDQASEGWNGYVGYITTDILTAVLPKPGQGKVFISGPNAFLGSVSGLKGPNFTQGEVGGLLEKLGYTSADVYKF